MAESAKNSGGDRAVRFAIAGCGRIAQSHFEAVASSPNADVVAAIEVRETAGQAVAEEYQCRHFADYRDAEIDELADAVIICTPPNTHFELARSFLERGAHVLCEKPLTIRSDEAKELVSLSRTNGLKLMMASKFRYVDDIIKAKSIIEAGILGPIILYENSFCSKVHMRDRWNSQKDIAGGGVLIDNGCHSVDIARYLLGPIECVQAHNGMHSQGLEVEDTVRLQFRTHSGVMGLVDLSWSVNKGSNVYISVFGADGTLLIGWQGSRYRQDENSNWVPFGEGYNKLTAFARQIENFINCVRDTQEPLITPEDALASVQAIETAYVSASKSDWLQLEPTT